MLSPSPQPMETVPADSIATAPRFYSRKRRRLSSPAEDMCRSSVPSSSIFPMEPPQQHHPMGKLLTVFIRSIGWTDYMYSVHVLGLDSYNICKSVASLPDPILCFGLKENFPLNMGFFISGCRLYLFGGIRILVDEEGPTETYYIDFPIPHDADPLQVIKKGHSMNDVKVNPLVFPIWGKFYVISADLSRSTSFEVFDPDSQRWTALPELSCHVKNFQASFQLITSFKSDASTIYLSTQCNIYCFDIDKNVWEIVEGMGGLQSFPFIDRCIEVEGFSLCYHHSWGGLRAFDIHNQGFLNPIRLKGRKELRKHDKLVHFFHGGYLLPVCGRRFCCIRTGIDSYLDYFSMPMPMRHFIVDLFDIEILSEEEKTRLNYQKVSKSVYVLDDPSLGFGPTYLSKAFLLIYYNDPDSSTFLRTLNSME